MIYIGIDWVIILKWVPKIWMSGRRLDYFGLWEWLAVVNVAVNLRVQQTGRIFE